MSTDERLKIGELWLGLAGAMGHQLSASALSMMLEAVDDLDPYQVCHFLKNWMRGPNGRKFPLPADLRELCGAAVDDKTVALDASSLVIGAVSRFGIYQQRAAREHIGEPGWTAVERIGGWEYLCQNLGTRTLPLTTVQAQVRDVCEAQIKLGRQRAYTKRDLLAAPTTDEAVKILNSIKSNQPTKGDE